MKLGKRWGLFFVVLIFCATLGIRLYFSFSTPHFSAETAYFTLRQVEHIQQNGLPMFEDPLSAGGRSLVFPSFFPYILTLMSAILPIGLVSKLVPNIFAASIVFFIYLIVRTMTKHELAAVLASLLAAFVPIYTAETFNSISVYSLIVPLLFFQVYCLLKSDRPLFVYLYLANLVLFSLIHPSVLLFIVGIIFYLLLAHIEAIALPPAEVELSIFSIFFVVWIEFVLHKKLFLLHGIAVIWQNIPQELLSQFFSQVTIISAIYSIGAIPFVAGFYIIYRYLFQEKKKHVYVLIGFALAMSVLLWLRLIPLEMGLMILGVLFCIFFGQAFALSMRYLKKTKVEKYSYVFVMGVVALALLISIVPSVSSMHSLVKQSNTQEDIDALVWIRDHTSPGSAVIGSLEDGHRITAVAQRANVIDQNFLLLNDAAERFEDVELFFSTDSETTAVDLLEKYGIDYVFISRRVIFDPYANIVKFAHQSCFELVYDHHVKVYDARACHLRSFT